MKFKDFQAPALFSSTFKALNLAEKKFQYFQWLPGIRGNPDYNDTSQNNKVLVIKE